MGMRIIVGLVPILVVVVLWVTSKSSQLFPSTQLLGNPYFMFSIFNSIILLITVRQHEPPPHQQLEIMELLQSPYLKPRQDNEFCACDEDKDKEEDYEDHGNNKENEDGNRNEKERDEDEIIVQSNDEEEDENEDSDDDDEDDTEQWDEKEEDDEELEKRIEEFIAKVNKRWREEMLRDKLLIQICSSNVDI